MAKPKHKHNLLFTYELVLNFMTIILQHASYRCDKSRFYYLYITSRDNEVAVAKQQKQKQRALPMRPSPMTPTVLPERPYPHNQRGFHELQPPLEMKKRLYNRCVVQLTQLNDDKDETNFLTSSTPSGNLRAVASSRATVSSAVASVRTSGVYPTRIPLLKTHSGITSKPCDTLS